MVLYKDLITGDILFTDDYEIRTRGNFLYEVTGKMTEDGVNVAVENKLIGADIRKKTYQRYMKDYIDRIVEHLKQTDPKGLDQFKARAKDHIKRVVDNFKDVEFYTGESRSPDGMLVMCRFKGDEETPILTFWKHGIIKEE